MKPCTNCSPATRFNCDVCDGSGEMPELSDIAHATSTPVPGVKQDPAATEAAEKMQFLLEAAMQGHLLMGQGPHPYDPTRNCRIAFIAHPDDAERARAGDQNIRKLPVCIMLDETDILMLRNARPTGHKT